MIYYLNESDIEFKITTSSKAKKDPDNYRYHSFLDPKIFRDLKLSSYCKPRWNYVKIFKSHEYPGYLNMIDHCETMDDIKYIRMDINIGNADFKKINERINNCEKYGNCDLTKNYYRGIYNMYIKHDITSKDIELYSKWLNTVARDALNKKSKEIRSR